MLFYLPSRSKDLVNFLVNGPNTSVYAGFTTIALVFVRLLSAPHETFANHALSMTALSHGSLPLLCAWIGRADNRKSPIDRLKGGGEV
jgi:hypothetical protein